MCVCARINVCTTENDVENERVKINESTRGSYIFRSCFSHYHLHKSAKDKKVRESYEKYSKREERNRPTHGQRVRVLPIKPNWFHFTNIITSNVCAIRCEQRSEGAGRTSGALYNETVGQVALDTARWFTDIIIIMIGATSSEKPGCKVAHTLPGNALPAPLLLL